MLSHRKRARDEESGEEASTPGAEGMLYSIPVTTLFTVLENNDLTNLIFGILPERSISTLMCTSLQLRRRSLYVLRKYRRATWCRWLNSALRHISTVNCNSLIKCFKSQYNENNIGEDVIRAIILSENHGAYLILYARCDGSERLCRLIYSTLVREKLTRQLCIEPGQTALGHITQDTLFRAAIDCYDWETAAKMVVHPLWDRFDYRYLVLRAADQIIVDVFQPSQIDSVRACQFASIVLYCLRKLGITPPTDLVLALWYKCENVGWPHVQLPMIGVSEDVWQSQEVIHEDSPLIPLEVCLPLVIQSGMHPGITFLSSLPRRALLSNIHRFAQTCSMAELAEHYIQNIYVQLWKMILKRINLMMISEEAADQMDLRTSQYNICNTDHTAELRTLLSSITGRVATFPKERDRLPRYNYIIATIYKKLYTLGDIAINNECLIIAFENLYIEDKREMLLEIYGSGVEMYELSDRVMCKMITNAGWGLTGRARNIVIEMLDRGIILPSDNVRRAVQTQINKSKTQQTIWSKLMNRF